MRKIVFSVNIPVTSQKLIAVSLIDTQNDSRTSRIVLNPSSRPRFLSLAASADLLFQSAPSFEILGLSLLRIIRLFLFGRNSAHFASWFYSSLYIPHAGIRGRSGDGFNVVLITDVDFSPNAMRKHKADSIVPHVPRERRAIILQLYKSEKNIEYYVNSGKV